MTADYLSELPLDLRATVLTFRAELIAAREKEAARLHTFEHFKREVEIETAHAGTPWCERGVAGQIAS